MKIKQILISIGIGSIGIAVLALLIFVSSDVQKVPPSNLAVMADHKYKTFISPECLNLDLNYDTDDFEIVTYSDAKDLDYTIESTCTEDSLFPSRNSAWDFIGTKIGFLKPLGWKWNEDGTWKEEAFQ